MKNIYALAAVLLLAAVSMSAQTRLQLNNTAPGGGYGASFIILPPLTPTTGTVELRFPSTSGTALIEDASGVSSMTNISLEGKLQLKPNPLGDVTYNYGLNFGADPYGGTGDLSGMRLISNGADNQILELFAGNDAGDEIRLTTVSNDGVEINGFTALHTGNTSDKSLTFDGLTASTSFTSNGTTTLGNNIDDNVTITGALQGQYPLYFEGSTANGFETRLSIADPTADRTITLPDADGTIMVANSSGDLSVARDLSVGRNLTVTGTSNFTGAVNVDGGLTIQHNPANDSATYTLGLRFQNDPYGGGSDLAGLRMYNRNNDEDMIMEFYTNNDGNDKINFSVNDGTYGVTINNYPIITTNNASTLLGGSSWLVGGNTVGSVQRLGSNDNYAIAFETNNTERMRLDTDGDLGIGTTNPDAPLHVARATSNGTTYVMLMNSAPANNLGSAVQISFSNDVGATKTLPNAFIRSENTGGANNAATLSFGTYDGTAVTTKMSIDPDGVVGVSNKLVVGATATTVPMELRASGALGVGENYRNTDAAVFNVRNTGSTTTSNAAVAISTNNSTGGDPILSWDIEQVAGWSMGIDNADDDKLKIIDTWDFDIASGNTLMTLDMTSNSVSMMEIRLLEPSASGSNFTAFKAQAQSGDITYTLPAADGSSGQFLSTNGSGTLSWSNAGLQYFTASRNSTAPNATVPVHQLIASGTETDIDMALRPKGTGALIADIPDDAATGGNKRGASAVDLQRIRSAATQVASGTAAVIGGGGYNTASGIASTVAGGALNIASGDGAVVGGGDSNQGGGRLTTVAGGFLNRADGNESSVGGGEANIISSTGAKSVIAGGSYHNVTGSYSGVLSGRENDVTGDNSVVLGGQGFKLSGNQSLGFIGSSNFTTWEMSVSADNTAVFANVNFWLANNNNTASELRFYEAQSTNVAFPAVGTNYTAFKAGTQAADITYTLPTADGSSGQMLSTNGSGTLSWASALTASSQSTYTATAITGLTYTTNNINLAGFTGTYEKIDVPAPGANSTVTLPTGTDGQVMYVRFAFTAGTGTVTINNDGGTATAMVYDGAGSDVIVAHMLYTTTEKWVVLSAQYFNN